MYYVTYPLQQAQTQINTDIFALLYDKGVDAINALTPPIPARYLRTRTVCTDNIQTQLPTLAMRKAWEDMRPAAAAAPIEYTTFRIPKASGGMRTINAPCEDLKLYQRAVTHLLRYTSHMYEHDAAFAYVPGRSTKDALLRHVQADSRWYLKLDLKDFFPSCTEDFVYAQLSQMFPICCIPKDTVQAVLRPCFLNGALPQGAPSSPILTNLLMVPTDHGIVKALRELPYTFTYTRYADDLLISAAYAFPQEQVVEIIRDVLPTQLQLNAAKIRYGSNAGRNWNLGLMVNQKNQITLGYKEKQRLRAAIHSIMVTPEAWTPEEKNELRGQLAYLKYIEPDYFAAMVQKYERTNRCSLAERLSLH